MNRKLYNHLQLREIFHLEFLRWLAREVKAKYYVLKGGINLRFFFNSIRYSEDMDLDAQGITVEMLRKVTMKILQSAAFQDNFIPFGVERVVPPEIRKAKQTETTQRFKIHLITSAGEDLFTKIEFSRRGFKGLIDIQTVSTNILRIYKLPPLLVPHYNAASAAAQKIDALATRTIIQARDIFDLYILISQYTPNKTEEIKINGAKLTRAYDNVFEINFEQFRDTVISYLSSEEQVLYNSASLWDEIKLKVVSFIEELRK